MATIISWNQAAYQSMFSPDSVVDVLQTANNISTITNKETQFSDGLGAGIGLFSITFATLANAAKTAPGIVVSASHAAAITGLSNVATHGAQGNLEAKHVVDAMAAIADFLVVAREVAIKIPAPQAKALAVALSLVSLALEHADDLGYVFGDEFNNNMNQAVQDLDAMLNDWYDSFIKDLNQIRRDMANSFNASRTPPRRDPLVLDLDGDGIETGAENGYRGVLFDHNGDGVKTATGWVKADDGLLVWDRNGNGLIDNGTELFGDNTAQGTGAAGGFNALGSLNSNGDGRIDASDTLFTQLRVWRDLNQDGISQAHELFTLDSLGITSLNLGYTSPNTDLGNGNAVVRQGNFTRTDGSMGTLGDLSLRESTLEREFITPVAVTAAAAALPELQGAGMVRDLREAANDIDWKRAA